MAESVSVYGDLRQNQTVINSYLNAVQIRKVNLIRSVDINIDAAPSDTTFFTVPEGKKFLLQKIEATKSTTNMYGLPIYDAAGDSITPANNCILRANVTSDFDGVPAYINTLSSPILVEKGLTLEGTYMPASCHVYVQIEGVLIG